MDVLACDYQDFDHDVAENIVLREALRAVTRLSSVDGTRQDAQSALEAFEAIAPGPFSGVEPARRSLVYDRRNNHYRPAHTWGLALLESHLPDGLFQDHGHRTQAFLLSMNQLFESFVAALLTERLSGSQLHVEPQAGSRGVLWTGAQSWGSIRPDIVLRGPGGSLAVDTKYKLYDQKAVAAGDLYQTMLYAQAFTGLTPVPTSVLVYPGGAESRSYAVDLRPDQLLLARVRVEPLPLVQVLADLRHGLGGQSAPLTHLVDLVTATPSPI